MLVKKKKLSILGASKKFNISKGSLYKYHSVTVNSFSRKKNTDNSLLVSVLLYLMLKTLFLVYQTQATRSKFD